MANSTKLEQLIATFKDIYLGQDYITSRVLQKIEIDGNHITLHLQFGYPVQIVWPLLEKPLLNLLQQAKPNFYFHFNITQKIQEHVVQTNVAAISQIKNVIAIASGKGGVGKSTTAVNIAIALALQGARVGLLDADIYGPNQPHMLKVKQKPKLSAEQKLEPIWAHGLQTMSIGYLVNENTPAIWRGPMVSSALQQLVMQTAWNSVDYLIVDMPPGTGDIQLTLAKKVPVTAAVMVTTPQDIALLDVRKGLEMFRKVDVHVLGVIENMSGHVCSQCGHIEAIFGSGGAAQLTQLCDVPLLGQLPLHIAIRECADQGHPIALQTESLLALKYRDIALTIAALLSCRPRNYAAKFGAISVEK